MRQVFVKFVHSKTRFVDCFPPAYHNSFSVCWKRCLSCYKYHFDGYRISSWQRKWFSLHSSRKWFTRHCISFVTWRGVLAGIGFCGHNDRSYQSMWLIDLFNSNDMDRKIIYVCIHTNFSSFMRLLFISITENERMSKQHVNERNSMPFCKLY